MQSIRFSVTRQAMISQGEMMTARYVSFNAIFMLLKAECKMHTQCKEAKEQIEKLFNEIAHSSNEQNLSSTHQTKS